MFHKHVDDLGQNISNDIRHFREVTVCILYAVGELTQKADTIGSKVGKDG